MSSPSTRASLLLRMRDRDDRAAWGEFVQLYAPLIHVYGRKRGLQDADAADLAQDVLRAVARRAPADGILTVAVAADRNLEFNLHEPCELSYGWLLRAQPRTCGTWATLAQGGTIVPLMAPQESIRAGQAAGWPAAAAPLQTSPVVRLWAADIVALVEFLRLRPLPAPKSSLPQPILDAQAGNSDSRCVLPHQPRSI